MTQRQKKSPSPEASALVPEGIDPPHVQAAFDRFKEHAATCPPNITLTKDKKGAVTVATDKPNIPHGMLALMEAVGTHDEQFFSGYLSQIINLTSVQSGLAQQAGNANVALGFIRGLHPRDEVEAALAAQMYATHNTAMIFARRMTNAETIPQQDSAINAYNKLTRTFTAQLEALKRYRSTGEQKVTVQHVTVSDGGQAIVGGTVTAGGQAPKKDDTTP